MKKIILIIVMLLILFGNINKSEAEMQQFAGVDYDKLLHFSAGYIIFTGSSWFENQWQVRDSQTGELKKFEDKYRIFSWICVVGFASLKESVDSQWDWSDWSATILGGGVGSIIVYSW